MTAPTRSIAPMKIETKAQAETLIADIGSVLERLAAVINEETRLIRAAKVVAATQLDQAATAVPHPGAFIAATHDVIAVAAVQTPPVDAVEHKPLAHRRRLPVQGSSVAPGKIPAQPRPSG